MTDEEYRIEKIKDYRRDVLKYHTVDEMRRRFAERSFDDTFAAMGLLIDPQLKFAIGQAHTVWLGYEYLCDSKMLDLKYAHLFD
jgi:hypothetical protein